MEYFFYTTKKTAFVKRSFFSHSSLMVSEIGMESLYNYKKKKIVLIDNIYYNFKTRLRN
jgi:hypothetical protein